jgi:hypothetical protein
MLTTWTRSILLFGCILCTGCNARLCDRGADGHGEQFVTTEVTNPTSKEQTLLTQSIEGAFQKTQDAAYIAFPKEKMAYAPLYLFRLTGVDTATFVPLGNYAKDKWYAYHSSSYRFCADTDSFVPMGNLYAKDRKRVYFQDVPLPDADPTSARVVDDYLLVDNEHVYQAEKLIPGADPHTFTVIMGSYTKDGTHVYYNQTVLPDADPGTFRVLDNENFAKDEHSVYTVFYDEIRKIPGADPATFQTLHDAYAKDKNQLYYGGQVVEGVNPETFQ